VQTVELVIGPPVEPRADPIPIHFVDVGDLVNGVPTIRKQNRVRPHSTARRHIRLHDLLELLTLCFGERLDELRGSFHSPLILSQNLCLGAYEHLPAAEAFALAERFEFHYTPKSASWLNMIEIEFSALSRQCLDRRIPTIERLEKEVLQLIKERSEKRIRIHWQFSIEGARKRLNSHYQRVNADNIRYKE